MLNSGVSCLTPLLCSELAALAREAEFYMLPGLLERIQGTAIMPQVRMQQTAFANFCGLALHAGLTRCPLGVIMCWG